MQCEQSAMCHMCVWCPGTVTLVAARSNEGKTENLKAHLAALVSSTHGSSIECIKIMAPAVSLEQYRSMRVPCRLELGALPDSNDALPERSDDAHELTRIVLSSHATTIVVIDDVLSMLRPNQTHPFITDVCNSLAHRSCSMVFFLAQTLVNANVMTRVVLRCARMVHIKLCASQERDLLTLNRQYFHAQPHFFLDACKYVNAKHGCRWFTVDLREKAKFRLVCGVYDMSERRLLIKCDTQSKFHGAECVKYAVSASDYERLNNKSNDDDASRRLDDDASRRLDDDDDKDSAKSPLPQAEVLARVVAGVPVSQRERARALLHHLLRVNASTPLSVHIDAADMSLIVCNRRIAGSCMTQILCALTASPAAQSPLHVPGMLARARAHNGDSAQGSSIYC